MHYMSLKTKCTDNESVELLFKKTITFKTDEFHR